MTHTHPQPPIPPAAGDGNPAPTTGREPGDQPVSRVGVGAGAGGRVPGRVRRRRVAGWRLPPNTVVVERSLRWGNPLRVADWGRAKAIRRYRKWILTPAQLPARLGELAGRDLACTCPHVPCHADVLLQLDNPNPNPDGDPDGGGGWGEVSEPNRAAGDPETTTDREAGGPDTAADGAGGPSGG